MKIKRVKAGTLLYIYIVYTETESKLDIYIHTVDEIASFGIQGHDSQLAEIFLNPLWTEFFFSSFFGT